MARKKWTPKQEVTESLLKFRAKRKWQIALRRYLIEKSRCIAYAPYFGLDNENFRKWIEIQFDSDLDWSNFSKKWQLDHIIPVTYFDFNEERDLRLCWNFINVRVEKFQLNKNRGNRLDVMAAKSFFETLYDKTHYTPSLEMVKKISQIEISEIESTTNQQEFLIEHSDYLKLISGFSEYEFDKLNFGISINDILREREFLAKW